MVTSLNDGVPLHIYGLIVIITGVFAVYFVGGRRRGLLLDGHMLFLGNRSSLGRDFQDVSLAWWSPAVIRHSPGDVEGRNGRRGVGRERGRQEVYVGNLYTKRTYERLSEIRRELRGTPTLYILNIYAANYSKNACLNNVLFNQILHAFKGPSIQPIKSNR